MKFCSRVFMVVTVLLSSWTVFPYGFKNESEVPGWMKNPSFTWKPGEDIGLHAYDAWYILDEVSIKAGEGLCIDTVDMVGHRKNFGSEQRSVLAFVPSGGKIYATSIGSGGRCLFAGAGSIKDILSQIGSVAGWAPLANWAPKEGSFVGFAVFNKPTTKGKCPSPRCRSGNCLVEAEGRGVGAGRHDAFEMAERTYL